MREIKFRAWDRNERDSFRMKYNLFLNSAYFQQETLEGIEVMQFTGLKDRNGREIYEGDVVEWHDKRMKSHSVIGPVVWEKDGWNVEGFWRSSQDESGRAFSEGAEFVIIGNIYENPELLSA
jgi:uncharacterized phage protein (TIGR01671 family)